MDTPSPAGPWKEGRLAAFSLLYITPNPETFAWVLAHHAAVGIRATWLRGAGEDDTLPRSRNWDIREEPPAPLPPLLRPSPDPRILLDQIETQVTTGAWSVCRLEEADLSAMGREAHKTLLQRLGDHHARIWCAPLRDIANYANNNRNPIA